MKCDPTHFVNTGLSECENSLFQMGSFGEMCSLPTNLLRYSLPSRSAKLLVFNPIVSGRKGSGTPVSGSSLWYVVTQVTS